MPVFFLCIFVSAATAFAKDPNITVVPRTNHIANFPCSKCHLPTHENRFPARGKNPHTDLNFQHMPEVRQCILCHSPSRTDQLTLLDGTPIGYNEVDQLCRQCHGKISYNWDHGMHGRQTGYWNGPKQRLNCTECHPPHSPKFAPMLSVHTPIRPRFGIPKGERHP